jgi:hypothetical protein
MVPACLVKPGHEMIAAWACRSGAHCETAGKLRLSGSGQRSPLFVSNANPFDRTSPYRITQRIEGIADQAEHLFHANPLEHIDKSLGYRLRHLSLRKGFAKKSTDSG